MADRTVLHVSPLANGWKVKAEGAGPYEFEAVVDTKDDAERIAKEQARGQEPSQVIVHHKDGTFEYESTYGDDPRESKG
jgi:hypothetical protein